MNNQQNKIISTVGILLCAAMLSAQSLVVWLQHSIGLSDQGGLMYDLRFRTAKSADFALTSYTTPFSLQTIYDYWGHRYRYMSNPYYPVSMPDQTSGQMIQGVVLLGKRASSFLVGLRVNYTQDVYRFQSTANVVPYLSVGLPIGYRYQTAGSSFFLQAQIVPALGFGLNQPFAISTSSNA